VDLKDIKAIIDLMKKNAVSEFELEKQDFKIKLKRNFNGGGAVQAYEDAPAQVYLTAPQPPIALSSPAVSTPNTASASSTEVEIKSPMIGTFYRAPSPEAGAYVEVGTEVNPDSVVCIIEAMKVMNEIKAEVRGVITQVVMDNSKPVEFGQTLFKVRPL
jgi:acetyl-CoA carboxylase biotin carboxyl carrier protein